ncbi:hypothetical protein PC129_g8763 [Phytophthora cactorum]|uniref:Uncharacterized protein n=1 Tax=Phytophthora cactorum TaxID=29920 RepID=A0A8T1I5Q7_9STRA|nr:hypothetical protein PC129_g8763 [Phytophthora cactorum]
MQRKLTHLAPVMVERYAELIPFLLKIDHGSIADYGLESYLLSRRKSERKPTLTLSDVCRLFDYVAAEYPQLDVRLGTAAAINNNQPLESGIVKMQRHEALNVAERSACAMFRLADSDPDQAETSEERPSFVRSAFKRRKSKTGANATWTSVSFLQRQMNPHLGYKLCKLAKGTSVASVEPQLNCCVDVTPSLKQLIHKRKMSFYTSVFKKRRYLKNGAESRAVNLE